MKRSLLRKIDSRFKMIGMLLMIVGLIFSRTVVSFAIVGGATLLFFQWGNVPLSKVGRAVRSITLLLVFTVVLNALFTPGKPVVSMGALQLTGEGIARGIVYAWRLVFLVALTTVLTSTTSPMGLAEGVQFLLSPLRLIGVPVSALAVITSIALRFVPILLGEARRIHVAQHARGVDVGVTTPFQRVVSLGAVIVPLFAGALRRADELGDALEARGFRPGASRGSLYPKTVTAVDGIAVALCAVVAFTAVLFSV